MSSIYLQPNDLKGIAKKRIKYDRLKKELFKSLYDSQQNENNDNFDVSMDENYLHDTSMANNRKNIFQNSYQVRSTLSSPKQYRLVQQVKKRSVANSKDLPSDQFNSDEQIYQTQNKTTRQFKHNSGNQPHQAYYEKYQNRYQTNKELVDDISYHQLKEKYPLSQQEKDYLIESRLRSNIKKHLQGPKPPDVSIYDKHTLDCRFQPIINVGEIINILRVSRELRVIDFFGCTSLSDEDMLQIVPELCSKHILNQVDTIDLGATPLTERSLIYFLQKINNVNRYDKRDLYVRNLRYLYLNKLNCKYEKISAFIHALVSNAYFNIEEIYLKNNDINDHMALQLLQCIAEQKPLKVLNLQNNNITNEFLREYEVLIHVNGFIPVNTIRLELNQINQQLLESFYYRIERLYSINQNESDLNDYNTCENAQQDTHDMKQWYSNQQLKNDMQNTKFHNDYKSITDNQDQQTKEDSKVIPKQTNNPQQLINQQQTIQELINASDINNEVDSKQSYQSNKNDYNFYQEQSKLNGYEFIEKQLQEQKQLENMIIIPDINYKVISQQTSSKNIEQKNTLNEDLEKTYEQPQEIQINQVKNKHKKENSNQNQEQDLQESQLDVQMIPCTKFKRDLIAKLTAIAKEENLCTSRFPTTLHNQLQESKEKQQNRSEHNSHLDDPQTIISEESAALKRKIKETMRRNQQATAELGSLLQRSVAASGVFIGPQAVPVDEKSGFVPELVQKTEQISSNEQIQCEIVPHDKESDFLKQLKLLMQATDETDVLVKIKDLKEQLGIQKEEKRMFSEGVKNLQLLCGDLLGEDQAIHSDDPQSDAIDLVLKLYGKCARP